MRALKYFRVMFIPSVAAMNVLTAPLLIGLTTGLWTGMFVLSGGTDFGGVAFAQVTSDGTLSTTVTQTGNNFAIDQGDRVGNNLFHSFGQFSVPTGGSAIFNNAADIQNIFSRVTGGSLSNIDGLIQANGTANLFLLNPSGMLFGPNASLNIGGSFIGTTANSIKFADGVEFSTANASGTPLLTMSVPIGLQMGQNPGEITVQGNGHRLTNQISSRLGIRGTQGNPQLRVRAGQTLALIGGSITLNGGVLVANDGNVELAAIGHQNSNDLVQISPNDVGWTFDYREIKNFEPIQLFQRSLVEASSINPGGIKLTGSTITVADGSLALIQNRGTGQSNGLILNAKENLIVTGFSVAPSIVFSALTTYTSSSGTAGNIEVSAPQVFIRDRAEIRSVATGSGNAGKIVVNAPELIQLDNSVKNANGIIQGLSTIANNSSGLGNSGSIDLQTRRLRIFPGASISGATFGQGVGGGININASESVELLGDAFKGAVASITVSTGGSGSAGMLNIQTGRVLIEGGGSIRATNFVNGQGGTINIQAAESINIVGIGPDPFTGAITFPSQISASTVTSFIPNPSGNSGDIFLNTPSLNISQKGSLSVSNFGSGNSGDLVIKADRSFLDDQGKILATTVSGDGGNIRLELREVLLIRQGSSISTTAAQKGNGGNIAISAPVIVGLENSDILANAFQGQGGNIQITTQGIFGLKFRTQLTPANDITASSQFGISGTVQINLLSVNPTSGLAQLPVNLADASQQVVQGCAANQDSSFVITGRGGVPLNPMTQVGSDRPWTDTRDLSPYHGQQVTDTPQLASPTLLIEATGWRRNPQGNVELFAATGSISSPAEAEVTCVKLPASTAVSRL
jgi:filamentous hemagglutinin family protein